MKIYTPLDYDIIYNSPKDDDIKNSFYNIKNYYGKYIWNKKVHSDTFVEKNNITGELQDECVFWQQQMPNSLMLLQRIGNQADGFPNESYTWLYDVLDTKKFEFNIFLFTESEAVLIFGNGAGSYGESVKLTIKKNNSHLSIVHNSQEIDLNEEYIKKWKKISVEQLTEFDYELIIDGKKFNFQAESLDQYITKIVIFPLSEKGSAILIDNFYMDIAGDTNNDGSFFICPKFNIIPDAVPFLINGKMNSYYGSSGQIDQDERLNYFFYRNHSLDADKKFKYGLLTPLTDEINFLQVFEEKEYDLRVPLEISYSLKDFFVTITGDLVMKDKMKEECKMTLKTNFKNSNEINNLFSELQKKMDKRMIIEITDEQCFYGKIEKINTSNYVALKRVFEISLIGDVIEFWVDLL